MSGLGECVYNDGIAKGESYAFEVIKYINDYPEKSDEDVSAELHCNPSLVEEARKTIDNLKKSLQV